MGNTNDDKFVRVWGWHRGVSRLLMAAALFVMALSVSSDSKNDMAQEKANGKGRPGSIAGRITIQGNPAPGLEVALLPEDAYKPIATTKTEEDGRYRLTDLPANHYWLKVLAPEYVTTDEYDDEGPGRKVTLADGESVEDADLDLLPGGVISGTITDVDGNPVAGESVTLTQVDKYGPWHRSMFLSDNFETDSKGAYRIYGIPAGRYLVSIGEDIALLTGAVRAKYDYFGPSGRVGNSLYYEQTFYPGVTDKAQAHIIDISVGEEAKEINLTVGRALRAYTASGRIVDAQTDEPVRNCHLVTGYKAIGGEYSSSAGHGIGAPYDTDENGNFQIDGLIPGRFFVSALIEGDTDLYADTVDFEVTGEDVTGLVVKAYRGVTLSGSISIEDNNEAAVAQLSQLKLSAWLDTGRMGHGYLHREASINDDGSFKIGGLRPGLYTIYLGLFPMDLCFSIVRIEYPKSQDGQLMEIVPVKFFNDGRVKLGDKGLTGARVILAYHNAIIRGRIKVVGGKLASDARLEVSISRVSVQGQGGFSTGAMVDANGYFVRDGLEPGEYEITAYDDGRRLSATKTVSLMRNAEAEVSFVLDLSARKEKD